MLYAGRPGKSRVVWGLCWASLLYNLCHLDGWIIKLSKDPKHFFDKPQSEDNMSEENFNQSVWKRTFKLWFRVAEKLVRQLQELNLQSRRLIMTHSLICSVTHSHALHMLGGYPEKGASAGYCLWNLWKDWVKNRKGLTDVNLLDVTKYDYLTWNRNKVKKDRINKAQKCVMDLTPPPPANTTF